MAKDPAKREVWNAAFGKEWGNLVQEDIKTGTKGTNSLFFLDHNKIKQIPTYHTVTYTNIVVYYLPQKIHPNRVRITAGDNLINQPRELTTRTAYLTTPKVLWNTIISTINEKQMYVDIKKFYLCNLLDRLEYMRITLSALPEYIIQKYN